jgi:hypothetical protein
VPRAAALTFPVDPVWADLKAEGGQWLLCDTGRQSSSLAPQRWRARHAPAGLGVLRL